MLVHLSAEDYYARYERLTQCLIYEPVRTGSLAFSLMDYFLERTLRAKYLHSQYYELSRKKHV